MQFTNEYITPNKALKMCEGEQVMEKKSPSTLGFLLTGFSHLMQCYHGVRGFLVTETEKTKNKNQIFNNQK